MSSPGDNVQPLAPLVFGRSMDHQQFGGVFLGLALLQGVLIFSAFNLGRFNRASKPVPVLG